MLRFVRAIAHLSLIPPKLNIYIIHKLFLLSDYQQYDKNKSNMKIARDGLIFKQNRKYFSQQFKRIRARIIKTLHNLLWKEVRESEQF